MAYISKEQRLDYILKLYLYFLRNKGYSSQSMAETICDRFIKFIEKYGSNYGEEELEVILKVFGLGLNEQEAYLMNQIYSSLWLLDENNDPYIRMLNVIEQEHGVIGKNILEIGAGPFPRLAELISIKQNGNGSITAYDPSLVTDYLHDVRLVKEKFTNTALLNNYDLVVAMFPCQGTRIILRSKRFIFSLCNCNGEDEAERKKLGDSYDAWIECIRSEAESLCDNSESISVLYDKKPLTGVNGNESFYTKRVIEAAIISKKRI